MSVSTWEPRYIPVLHYCKLWELREEPEVQTLIPMFYGAATEYLVGSGADEPLPGEAGRSQYDLLRAKLVLEAWDHRDAVERSGSPQLDRIFESFLHQLRFSAGFHF